MKIRTPESKDIDKLVQLGNNTGIFGVGEAEILLRQTLISLLDGSLPKGHQARLLEQDEDILGWIYFGPMDNITEWNLWWIGVEPKFHGAGYGKVLLRLFESTAVENNAAKFIIETSSAPLLERARYFYNVHGYSVCKVEKDAYGPGEDKIVYVKEFTKN